MQRGVEAAVEPEDGLGMEALTELQYREPQLRAELAKRDLYFFLKGFWDTIVFDPFQDNWHIEKLCRELEEVFWRVVDRQPKEYDLVINIPPGTTKSTIVTKMFPVWGWVNAPELNFITGSYGADLSLEHADISRDIIGSNKFREYYPYIKLRGSHEGKKSLYQLLWRQPSEVGTRRPWRPGGKRYSTSVGGSITGMHGHIIIVDDPLNPKQAEAVGAAHRKAANSWIDRTLSTRRVDKAITPLIIIMQRLHQDDPTGHLLKKDIPIRHINLPGEMVGGDIKVKPKEWEKHYVNGLLDPVRLNRKVLKDLNAYLGNYGHAGQILQNPVPPEGGMFQPEELVVLQEPPSPVNVRRKVYYWDKAGTEGGGDYTAGVLMWEMKKGFFPQPYVIVKVKRGQWSTSKREEVIKQEADAVGPDVLTVVEQEPGSGGKESAEGTIRNLGGKMVAAERPSGDKTLRADPFSVQVNWGNVAIVQGPWYQDFYEEMKFFPFSTYKDQIDAASGAFNRLRSSKRVGAW